MNFKQTILILILGLCFSIQAFAQEPYQFGFLPVLNLSKKLNNGFKLNLKTESRQVWLQDEDWSWQHELVDLSPAISKKIGVNNAIAAGYLIRFRNGETIHRAIQQFTINRRLSSVRMSHRFATDQTFEQAEDVSFRFRYRISIQIPLNGQSVDAGEWYVKVNNEILNAFEGSNYNLEYRSVIVLGYEITDNNKIEFGSDQRFDSFISDALRSRGWFNFSWYTAF